LIRRFVARTRDAARLRFASAGVVPRGFESQLTWVFGSPRSGSTWLLALLAEHPRVVPVNEPLIGDYLAPFLSDLPGAVPDGLDADTFTIRKVRRDRDHMFSPESRDVWLPLFGRLLRGRFLAHAVRHPKAVPVSRARVVIKEPNGSQSADLIMAALPHARLLFLLRDGRDVVDSELAANLRGSWVSKEFPGLHGIEDADRLSFVVQSAYKWLWRTEVVQAAFDAHPGPKRLLRYEELRRDPIGQLRPLFRWLDADAGAGDLERWVAMHAFEQIPSDARGPQAFFRAAEPGGWRENLRVEEQTAVEKVIGPKLRELGYDL
jgi:hypothetical protein